MHTRTNKQPYPQNADTPQLPRRPFIITKVGRCTSAVLKKAEILDLELQKTFLKSGGGNKKLPGFEEISSSRYSWYILFLTNSKNSWRKFLSNMGEFRKFPTKSKLLTRISMICSAFLFILVHLPLIWVNSCQQYFEFFNLRIFFHVDFRSQILFFYDIISGNNFLYSFWIFLFFIVNFWFSFFSIIR